MSVDRLAKGIIPEALIITQLLSPVYAEEQNNIDFFKQLDPIQEKTQSSALDTVEFDIESVENYKLIQSLKGKKLSEVIQDPLLVKHLQIALNKAGFPVPVNGYYGSADQRILGGALGEAYIQTQGSATQQALQRLKLNMVVDEKDADKKIVEEIIEELLKINKKISQKYITSIYEELNITANSSQYIKQTSENPLATEIAYLVFYNHFHKIDNDYNKNWHDFNKGEKTLEEFKKTASNMLEDHNDSIKKTDDFLESYTVFKAHATLDISEIINLYPHLASEEVLIKEAVENNIEFRADGKDNNLYVNYFGGLPLGVFNFNTPTEKLREALTQFIEDFRALPVKDLMLVKLNADAKNLKEEYIEHIQLFEGDRSVLKNTSKAGVWLDLMAFDEDTQTYRVNIMKGNHKKASVTGGAKIFPFWQNYLIQTIERASQNFSRESESLSWGKYYSVDDFKDIPDSLTDDQKLVKITDLVLNAFNKGLALEYENYRAFVDSLPEKLQISSANKNTIILKIYQKFAEMDLSFRKSADVYYMNFFEVVYKNLNTFLIPTIDFLKDKKLNDKEFEKEAKAHHDFFMSFVNYIVKKAPDLALQNIHELTYKVQEENYMKPHKTNKSFPSAYGLSQIYVSIMKVAFQVNPKLINKYKDLYERNPALKHLIQGLSENLGSYSSAIKNPEVNSILNFASAGHAPGSMFIVKHTKNSFITEITGKLSPIELTDFKLAIARNISFSNNLEPGRAIHAFLNNKKEVVQSELQNILKLKSENKDMPIFSGYNVTHVSHYGQGVDAFGNIGTQNAIRRQQDDLGQYSLFDAKLQKAKSRKEQKQWLKSVLNSYVKSNKKHNLLLEGHAAASSFSVLLEYDDVSKHELFYSGLKTLSITPSMLADTIVKRQKYREKFKITDPDIILFTACEGDFILNVYAKLNSLLGSKFDSLLIPPVILAASEAGENSIFNTCNDKKNLKCAIPQQFLREGLNLKAKGEKSTFGTFYKYQYSEGMSSNLAIYFPALRNDMDYPAWVPQNGG